MGKLGILAYLKYCKNLNTSQALCILSLSPSLSHKIYNTKGILASIVTEHTNCTAKDVWPECWKILMFVWKCNTQLNYFRASSMLGFL